MADIPDINQISRIAVFGEGKTATSVRQAISRFKAFTEVDISDNADMGVLSPGIPPEDYIDRYPYPLVSELEFADNLFRSVGKEVRYIMVSGTNGKTTTTSLISQLYSIPAAGNIGIPLIDFADPDANRIPEMFSLECSSYQLEQSPHIIPFAYLLLNITEDHLHRHRTMDNYARIKMDPVRRIDPSGAFIYNGNDRLISDLLTSYAPLPCTAIDFQQQTQYDTLIDASPLPGLHNRDNLRAVLSLSRILPIPDLAQKIPELEPVPHRMEPIRSIGQVRFINDSKATNPDSTLAALKSFNPSQIICLLGGEKKEADYTPLFDYIRNQHIRVISFGKAREFFKTNLNHYPLFLSTANTLSEAVSTAYKNARINDIILLSPGCASFDQYANFEERGHDFRNIISKISD